MQVNERNNTINIVHRYIFLNIINTPLKIIYFLQKINNFFFGIASFEF